jgi:hypothetical protein
LVLAAKVFLSEFQRDIAALQGDAKLLSDRRRILLSALESGRHIHIQIQFHNGEQ